jgi:hypothetical protein
MTRKRKIAAAGVLVAGVALWFSIPALFRWRINKKPGLHVDQVDVHFKAKCLDLYGVNVDRGWVKGRLDKAKVCADDTLVVEGGDVTLLPDQRAKSGGDSSGGYKVTATHLTIHVTKGEVQADLSDVSVTDTQVCSSVALVKHPKAEVEAKALCTNRDLTLVSFPSAKVKPLVKVFDHEVGDLTLGATAIQPKEGVLTTLSAEVHGVTATMIRVTYTNSLASAKIDTARFQHPRLHTESLTFTNVEFGPIDPTKPLDGDHTIRANGISLGFNLKEQHLWGSQTCQEWYEAVPPELRLGVMSGLTFKGDFKFDLHVKPAVKLDWTLTCKNHKPESEK